MTHTPEYQTWCNMRRRCEDTSNIGYANYGGRGIMVCVRWRESFEAFRADMGQKPSPRHSIERKNNNVDYEPGNCVWATPAQQSRNTRQNRLLTIRGKTMCLSDWASAVGLNRGTLESRLKRGWSVDRAVNEATHMEKRNHKWA